MSRANLKKVEDMGEHKLEFSNSFIPVQVKYCFEARDKWFECNEWKSSWLNIRPFKDYSKLVQISCYPKNTNDKNDLIEHFDYNDLKLGKAIVDGETATALVWYADGKTNRICFVGDQDFMIKKYNLYLKHMFLIMSIFEEIDNEGDKTADESSERGGYVGTKTLLKRKLRESRRARAAEKAIADAKREKERRDLDALYAKVIPKDKRPNYKKPKLVISPDEKKVEIVCSMDETSLMDPKSEEAPIQVMRIEDESGTFEEVELRSKAKGKKGRLARPLAVFSSLFNAFTSKLPSGEPKTKDKSRKSWNIFRSKPKKQPGIPTYMHFNQPADVESLTLSTVRSGHRYSDWFKMNSADMKKCETRIHEIMDQKNMEIASKRHSKDIAEKSSMPKGFAANASMAPNTSAADDFSIFVNTSWVSSTSKRSSTSYDDYSDTVESTPTMDADNYAIMKPMLENLAHQTKLNDDITNIINGLPQMSSTPKRNSSGFASAVDSGASSSCEDKYPCPVTANVVVVSNKQFAMTSPARENLEQIVDLSGGYDVIKFPGKPKSTKSPKNLSTKSPVVIASNKQFAMTSPARENLEQIVDLSGGYDVIKFPGKPKSTKSPKNVSTKSPDLAVTANVVVASNKQFAMTSPARENLEQIVDLSGGYDVIKFPGKPTSTKSPKNASIKLQDHGVLKYPGKPEPTKSPKNATTKSADYEAVVASPQRVAMNTNKVPRIPLAAYPPLTPLDSPANKSLRRAQSINGARPLNRSNSRKVRRTKVDNFFSYNAFADCYKVPHSCIFKCSGANGPCTGHKADNDPNESVPYMPANPPVLPPRNTEQSMKKKEKSMLRRIQFLVNRS